MSHRKSDLGENALTKRLRYIYHGYVQIAEIDATDETAPYVAKTYRWDPSEPVATRPLALTLWTREGTARETLYYAHDLRKNVVSLFDGKGLRRASYQYDPYGNITSMEGDMAEENPFRFSSEHHDEDLGLVYYNYRHYNPTDGRWISRDPIAEEGGWNLYGFTGNRPVDLIDLLGTIYTQSEPPLPPEPSPLQKSGTYQPITKAEADLIEEQIKLKALPLLMNAVASEPWTNNCMQIYEYGGVLYRRLVTDTNSYEYKVSFGRGKKGSCPLIEGNFGEDWQSVAIFHSHPVRLGVHQLVKGKKKQWEKLYISGNFGQYWLSHPDRRLASGVVLNTDTKPHKFV